MTRNERSDKGEPPCAWKGLGTAIRIRGGRVTPQRLAVARVFYSMQGHPSAMEIAQAVQRAGANVGLATVYRTMALLIDLGFATAAEFGDGVTRYESRRGGHHDHLICLGCGKIIEFTEPSIEELQASVARRLGFRILDHRLEITGLCRECSRMEGQE